MCPPGGAGLPVQPDGMELQVSPHAASSEEEQNPEGEGVRRDQQRAAVCGHHINNTPCLGLVLLLPPLNLLLL